MVSAGLKLCIEFERLFHVTCFAHLHHNAAMKVSDYFLNVNNMIACIKASIIKNKKRKMLFNEIGLPPDTIITRWGSWLKTAKYYSENFNEVRKIVLKYEDDGIIVRKAKNQYYVRILNKICYY